MGLDIYESRLKSPSIREKANLLLAFLFDQPVGLKSVFYDLKTKEVSERNLLYCDIFGELNIQTKEDMYSEIINQLDRDFGDVYDDWLNYINNTKDEELIEVRKRKYEIFINLKSADTSLWENMEKNHSVYTIVSMQLTKVIEDIVNGKDKDSRIVIMTNNIDTIKSHFAKMRCHQF
jgi:hypothetical protein